MGDGMVLVDELAALEQALDCITRARETLAARHMHRLVRVINQVEDEIKQALEEHRERVRETVKREIAEKVLDEVIDCYRQARTPYDCNILEIVMEKLGVKA